MQNILMYSEQGRKVLATLEAEIALTLHKTFGERAKGALMIAKAAIEEIYRFPLKRSLPPRRGFSWEKNWDEQRDQPGFDAREKATIEGILGRKFLNAAEARFALAEDAKKKSAPPAPAKPEPTEAERARAARVAASVAAFQTRKP